MTNPYSQPITVDMVETIRAIDPRDHVDYQPSRARNLAILNYIFGTDFDDEGGCGTYQEPKR